MRKILTITFLLIAMHGKAQQIPQMLKDINLGNKNGVGGMVNSKVLNNKLYFTAQNTDGNYELWVTDGTSVGTNQVADINSATSSFPMEYYVFNNILYFSAITVAEGRELWKSDGTSLGTIMVQDIFPNTPNSSPNNFIEFDSDLFFLAKDPAGGGYYGNIYKIDGTTSNLSILNPKLRVLNDSFFVKLNNRLYFSADTLGGTGQEIWGTDGTISGTTILKDINPTGDCKPNYLTLLDNNRFVFQAEDMNNNAELYISNGTEAGTGLIKDINPNGESAPFDFQELNGKMCFTAMDDVNGRELWVTDGTTLGTTLLKDIFPGNNSSVNIMVTGRILAKLGNKIVFAANDGVHGKELWVTDGTSNGTVMLKDIYPGSQAGLSNYDISNRNLVVNDKLYFSAEDGVHGYEPWVTDGTEIGTQMIYDLNPGRDSSMLGSGFARMGNKIYFSATDGNSGYEIWSIDVPINVENLHSIATKIQVHPNPTTGIITVQTGGTKLQADVYNSIGQMIYRSVICDSYIDLSNKAPGMYFIHLEAADKSLSQTVKVIKQ